MKYENAKDVLSEALFRELQKQAAGKLLYVPHSGARRPWGEKTGYKRQILARNREIRRKYAEGASIDSLADEFFLTPESVKKIIYDKKERNAMELAEIMKLYSDETPIRTKTVNEIVKDSVKPPIYFLETAVAYPERKITLFVCDYSFVTPDRIAQCARVIDAYRAKDLRCPQIVPNRYGNLTHDVSYNGRECTVFAQELPEKPALADCEKAREPDGRFLCHDALITAAAEIASLCLRGDETAAMEIFEPFTACSAFEDFTEEYVAELKDRIVLEHPALIGRFERVEALFRENREILRPLYKKLPTSLFHMMEMPEREVLVNEDGTLAGFRDFYNGGKETCLGYLFHVIDNLYACEYEGGNACGEMESETLGKQRTAAFEKDLRLAAKTYRFSDDEIRAAPMAYKNMLLGERYYWQIEEYAGNDENKLAAFLDYLARQLAADEIDFENAMRPDR